MKQIILIWRADKKVAIAMAKGFSTGLVDGLISKYIKGFNEIQKFIDSNGTKVLGKSGLNLVGDMRFSNSKYIRDTILGEIGINSTTPVWKLVEIFSNNK